MKTFCNTTTPERTTVWNQRQYLKYIKESPIQVKSPTEFFCKIFTPWSMNIVILYFHLSSLLKSKVHSYFHSKNKMLFKYYMTHGSTLNQWHLIFSNSSVNLSGSLPLRSSKLLSFPVLHRSSFSGSLYLFYSINFKICF